MTTQIAWQDMSERSTQVLTMVAAVLLNRVGGKAAFAFDEVKQIGGPELDGFALMITFDDVAETWHVSIETMASAAQVGDGTKLQ